MHDALHVRRAEGVGDGDPQVHGRLGRERTAALEPVAQGLALDPAHGQIRHVPRGPMRDVADDPRMDDAREELGLAGKAAFAIGCRPVQELQGDGLARRAIGGPVHRRHAAGAGARFDRESICDDRAVLHVRLR